MEINNDIPPRTVMPTDTPPPAQPDGSAPSQPPPDGAPVRPSAPQTQEHAIKEMLLASGFKASPENIRLASALLDAALPLNRENLQKLNQALRLLGVDIETGDLEKALFFLKNDMPPTVKNADMLRGFFDGAIKLMPQINSLIDAVNQLPDAALRESVLKALLSPEVYARQAQDAPGKGITDGQVSPNAAQSSANAPTSTGEPAAHPANAQAQTSAQAQANAQTVALQKNINQAWLELPTQAQAQNKPESATATSATAPREAPVPDTTADKAAASLSRDIPAKSTTPPPSETIPQTVGRSPEASTAPSLLSQTTAAGDEQTARQALARQPGTADNAQARTAAPEARLPQASPDAPLSAFALQADGSIRQKSGAKDTALAQIKQRLRFDPQGTTNKDVDAFLNRLRDGIEQARAELQKSGTQESARLLRAFTNLKESLEFVTHIKENIYLQLPIGINSHETNGEILVFRDRTARRRAGDGGSVSALIALDTAAMGRFEAYIQKTGKTVTCQFRLRDEHIEQLTRAHVSQLQTMLRAKGYDLIDVTYKKAEESFTLLGELHQEADHQPVHGQPAFDVRL